MKRRLVAGDTTRSVRPVSLSELLTRLTRTQCKHTTLSAPARTHTHTHTHMRVYFKYIRTLIARLHLLLQPRDTHRPAPPSSIRFRLVYSLLMPLSLSLSLSIYLSIYLYLYLSSSCSLSLSFDRSIEKETERKRGKVIDKRMIEER